MTKEHLNLNIEYELIIKIKVIAIKKHTTVSAMVEEWIKGQEDQE